MISKRGFWASTATLLLALFLAGGCSSGDDGMGPPGPQPGQLTVNVTTTGGGGAAFLVRLTGTGMTSPAAANAGHQLFSFASGNNELRAIVVGSLSSGGLLRFSVPDVNQSASYSVTLEEVAGSDNALQNTSDYTLTIAR